ncbi:MAG: hypothetical protein WC763_02020 [Candidatus Paceibacterota bacterium]|jgi:hypothetical protein
MASPSSQSADAKSLLLASQNEGNLSKTSAHILVVDDIANRINAGLGNPAINVAASEVTLVNTLIDDSGSIRMVAGNCEAVRTGHNLILESLGGAKANEGMQAMCMYLNGTQLYDYRPLSGAIKMEPSNYDPDGGTPLYDQSVVFLGTVLAKLQEFTNIGVPAKSISLIVTDGADQHSRKHSASDVASLVDDLLRQENHIVAFMGISDGRTDFRGIARDMGIRDEWILTPGNTQSEIRKAFGLFSQSAVKASQAGNFSGVGGFGG